MTRFFCPGCWADFEGDLPLCPACGLDIAAAWQSKSWEEKLLAALRHREPTTPLRAAWILGERRDPSAVPVLARLAGETVARAAARALARIGGPEAHRCLLDLLAHPAAMVRAEAAAALDVVAPLEAPRGTGRGRGGG